MGDGVDYKDEDKLGLCLYDRPDLCVAKNWLLVGVSLKKKKIPQITNDSQMSKINLLNVSL